MIHGILNIKKEKGYTSHDVVAKLRGILGQKKIGHTGTLDPDAIGVLPVCLGKATRLCDMLTDKRKTYEAVMLLGITTDTQDASGKVMSSCLEETLSSIRSEKVIECVMSFEGEYMQVPPMYSALKVNGKKLYELARQGVEVERNPRAVMIYEIKILEIQLPRITMEVTCSKGTYIRTLCHDIGEKLGCGACMESLVRTKVSPFTLEDSLTIDQVKEISEAGRLEDILVPIDRMFQDDPAVILKKEFASFGYNGNVFLRKHILGGASFTENRRVRVYDEAGTFIAIYEFQKETGLFQIVKMFYDRDGEHTCNI